MVEIDLKDRKILYHLYLNCRQSNAQIGLKVGLSKQVVDYRIKRMEEAGIITGYWTIIDSYRFGFEVYRYYLILQNTSSEVKEQMINHIVNYKNTWVVNLSTGPYDMSALIWVKSNPEFYRFWDDFNDRYGDYLAEKIFSIYLQAECYPASYLLADNFNKSDRETLRKVGGKEPIEINNSDYKLLTEIVENARAPLIELANKLHCSSQAASYRIKNLLKEGIIQGFRVGIDNGKIGFHWFKVDIWLKELSKKKQIWNYMKNNPYVTYFDTSVGYADLEIEFMIENSDKLIEVIDVMSSHFPGVVRKYIYFGVKKGVKVRSLPEL